MAEHKISFSFKPLQKNKVLLPLSQDRKNENKSDIELIQCIEDRSIKVVIEKEKEKPLVIPLLNTQKTSTALASLRNWENVLKDESDAQIPGNQNNTHTTGNTFDAGTIDQRVIKELLNEANASNEDEDESKNNLKLPLVDEQTIDGAKESNIEDYERIPITDFGKAMLRGMGLTDKEIISTQNKGPELRPKGMGLGADKIIKKPKLLIEPSANEILAIKKNAYVKILAGKYKDLYAQIEGLDDQTSRVIVKLALGGRKETLNEMVVHPVSRMEFMEYGKILNKTKYEEYKRKPHEGKAQSTSRVSASARDSYKDNRPGTSSNKSEKREKSFIRQSRSRSKDRHTTEYRKDRFHEKFDRKHDKYSNNYKGRHRKSSSDSSSSGSRDSRNDKAHNHRKKKSKKHKKNSRRN